MAAAAMATMRVQQACSKAAADELPTTLPPAFLAFLKQNGLDASIYAAAATLPRYVRCNSLCFPHPSRVFCCDARNRKP
jgi:hypothetical protein